MKEITTFLSKNKLGSLATCTEQQPDNRPMECVMVSEKGIFFYTSKGEDLAEQISKNPNICFVATDEQYNYVKMSGTIVLSQEEADKETIFQNSMFAKQVFSEHELSSMIVFYLPHGKGMLHLHGKNEPICCEF